MLFILPLLLLLQPNMSDKNSFWNHQYATIIADYKEFLQAECINIMDNTNSKIELSNRAKELRKILSRLHITTTFVDFHTVNMQHCKMNRPLNVVIIRNSTKLSAKPQLQIKLTSYPRWLVFLDSGSSSLDEIFDDVDVPFDCEVVVVESRDTDKVELTEIYRITEGEPLMKDHYGTWGPQGLKVNTKYLYERRNNLQGTTIRVVMVDDPPGTLVNVNAISGTVSNEGGCFGNIWKYLEIQLNFRTALFTNEEPARYRWGKQFENGSWSGMIGMLEKKQVQFSVGGFVYLKKRVLVVDYLLTTVSNSVQLVIREPDGVILRWSDFFSPIAPSLWYSILGSILLIGVMLSILHRIEYHYDKNVAKGNGMDCMLQILGLFFQQGQRETMHTSSARIVYLMAGVTSVVVLAAYSAALISSLANQKIELPFETLQGFFDDGTYKLGILDSTVVSEFFRNSSDPLMYKLYTKYFVQGTLKPLYDETSLHRVCSEKFAFLATRQIMEYYLGNVSCKIVWIPEKLFSSSLSMLASKDNPFRPLINHRLNQLRDSGIIQSLIQLDWPSDKLERQSAVSTMEVTLSQVLPLLAIFTTCVVVGILMLCLEIIIYRKYFRKLFLWISGCVTKENKPRKTLNYDRCRKRVLRRYQCYK